MASNPEQVAFNSSVWAELPSSIKPDLLDNRMFLRLNASGGDWKVTPTTTKIDGPTWGFWREPEAEGFEVGTEFVVHGNYSTKNHDNAGLMLYLSPAKWIKLDLAMTGENLKRKATITVCDGVSNKSYVPLPDGYDTTDAAAFTFAYTPDSIRAYVGDGLVAELAGFGKVEKVWVGVVACSPSGGEGAGGLFHQFTLLKGVREYDPDYILAGR